MKEIKGGEILSINYIRIYIFISGFCTRSLDLVELAKFLDVNDVYRYTKRRGADT